MVVKPKDIEEVRSFNRFHTHWVGALNEGLLDSDYSLIQARILYELANGTDVAAADLVNILSVDRGYLSRMITVLYQRGLLNKRPDSKNRKRIVLTLTTEGDKAFSGLNSASSQEVQKLIASLSEGERAELLSSMQKIRHLLGKQSIEQHYKLCEPQPGDMTWIAYRNARLYWNEYHWDWRFEALVCGIVGDFVNNFDPDLERCWVAKLNGEVIGSVFLVRKDETVAKLRLLYVEAAARGLGVGNELVNECIMFARQKGYKRLELWTNSILMSARKIYEAHGFVLIEEEPHHSFGHDLVGQIWALDL